jgi:hypothetical protein
MIKYVLGLWHEHLPVYVTHDMTTTHNLEEAAVFDQQYPLIPNSVFMWLPYFDPIDLVDYE